MNRDRSHIVAWRRRRILRWSVAGALLLAAVARRLRWGSVDLSYAVAAVALVALVVTLVLNVLFRCPGCANYFYWGRRRFEPLAGKCVHCHLKAG